MNKNAIYFFIWAFFIGVFFETFFQIFSVEFIFFIFLFFVYFLITKFSNKKIPQKVFFSFLIFFGFFLGTFRFDYFEKTNTGNYDNFINQKVSHNFIISEETEIKNGRQKIVANFQGSSSKVFLWDNIYPKRDYGELLYIEGYLKYPKNFKSETGRDFDYISYLKKEKIFYEILPTKIDFIKKDSGNFLKEYLFKIKKAFIAQIKKLIPSPESPLLGGILLGAKEDMGKDLLDNFRKTGVIHIVVLSGYNLSIVADFFMKIFAVFGIAFSSIFGAVSIVFFTIMTGASSTIVRASFMALIILFARATGRESEAIFALFFAGFIMLFWNPMLLVFDPSFQLSFLATLGLLVLSPKIEEKLYFLPNKFLNLRGILAATLSTQVFVFPFLLFLMGEISVISPIVNILILIFVPAVMFFGLVVVLVSFLNFYIGLLLSFPVYLILSYFLYIVDFFAKVPFAIFATKNFGFYFMAFWYFLYLLIFLFCRKKKSH